MNIFLVIFCSSFFISLIHGMEQTTLLKQEPDSLAWSMFPQGLMEAMKDENVKNSKIIYRFGESCNWCMQYSLRNIDPVKFTREGKANVNLAPHPDNFILLDPQFWQGPSRLCLDRANTNDYFILEKRASFFDGINNHRLALVANTNEENHTVYALHQSPDNSGTVKQHVYRPPMIFEEKGCLASILLHREINRCVRGIKNIYNNQNMSHCIAIGDISEKIDIKEGNNIVIERKGCFISHKPLPIIDKHDLIAQLATNFVLKKAIYIGKNTYLGLTEEGDMISFWLNDQNKIEYAQQKCFGKQFKDIDVDETSKTRSGFMPLIGLLAKNGDVYLTHLCMGQQPTLLYSCTLANPHEIFRFFYDKGLCAVVYNNKYNMYDTFHVWPAHFNFLLASLSLKNSQKKIIEQKK